MSTRPKVRIGSQGPAVRELQGLLNQKLTPSPRLNVDGDFGPGTQRAVSRFQRLHWLEEDGIVGDATWATLEGRDRYVILDVSARLFPQPTDSTCWSAATAMLLGIPMSVGAGGATLSGGGLLNDSDLNEPRNTSAFARTHGLTILPGQSWTADGLAGLLRAHKRIMINTLWDVAGYVSGRGSPGHMLVVVGIRGDGTTEGTTLRIHDPWPPMQGKIYSMTYGPLMRRVPASTYQIFHR